MPSNREQRQIEIDTAIAEIKAALKKGDISVWAKTSWTIKQHAKISPMQLAKCNNASEEFLLDLLKDKRTSSAAKQYIMKKLGAPNDMWPEQYAQKVLREKYGVEPNPKKTQEERDKEALESADEWKKYNG